MTIWLIFLTFLMSQFALVGTIQNQVPLLGNAGFPVAFTAGALGVVGLCSAFAKLGFGWLCDRIQPKHALAIGLVLQVAAILVLMNVGSGTPGSTAWIYAVAMGLGTGSWLHTISMLVRGHFGFAHYGAIFGVVTISYAVGSAVGPLPAGRMYDALGGYDGGACAVPGPVPRIDRDAPRYPSACRWLRRGAWRFSTDLVQTDG